MLFSSIPFLYYFLPVVLIAYFLMPSRGRNGLLLVADYSRNKGGLFSSRITPEIVWQHYPLRFHIAYAWAALGLNLLMLTPFLAVPVALCYLLYRVLAAFCRMFRKTFLTR